MTDAEPEYDIAARRIAEEAQQRTGRLDLTDLHDLERVPDALHALTHLRELLIANSYPFRNKRIEADWPGLATLSRLTSLAMAHANCTDLRFLANLTELRALDCSYTPIPDLAPIAALANLQSLDCGFTEITDLAPIAALTNLQSLTCYNTRITRLAPIAALANLRSLDCGFTEITDLAPIAARTNLQSLNCGGTQITDLAPVASLANLQVLDCFSTPITKLAPIATLAKLRLLNCGRTQITDLAPIAALANLQSLYCDFTDITDLAPLVSLSALERISIQFCHVRDFPAGLLQLPNLAEIDARDATIQGLPPGLLGAVNCLPALRAHFAELAQAPADMTDVRLLLLGNGRVGKTQLARWLHGLPFDADSRSTHGIATSTAAAPWCDGATLRLWDFGGQDIYHGTHALFLRRPALVLLAWSPAHEARTSHEVGDHESRNYPLDYWLHTIRAHLGADMPVLVVQTHCDHISDRRVPPPVSDELRNSFAHFDEAIFGAETRRGEAALREAITLAVRALRQSQWLGLPRIGASRLAVQRRLDTLVAEDAPRPAPERRHRWLTRAEFAAIAADCGCPTDPELLLRYFDATGLLLYRPGLFDKVILDQGWALDAIYTLFDRGGPHKTLQNLGGRFSRATLALLCWRDYASAEQDLLLGMMRACGMCFRYSRREVPEDEAEYLAPDLLPARRPDLAGFWNEAGASESARYRFAVLHPGLIRAIMSRLGALAGANAQYWRGGVWGYDATTRSRLLIEEIADKEGWRGEILLRTQPADGQSAARPAELLAFLTELADEALKTFGQTPDAVERAPPQPPRPEPVAPPAFTPEKSKMTEWAVSYAWGDDKTTEGLTREKAVDDACAQAEAKGIHLLRDKRDMRPGDSISAFERRIGEAERIFVFLSQKYLLSEHCMFELSEIWRTSRQEGPAFLDRVRVYLVDSVGISTPEQRQDHAEYWENRHDKLKARLFRSKFFSEDGARSLRKMQHFYANVADILATIADPVRHSSFQDFLDHGL